MPTFLGKTQLFENKGEKNDAPGMDFPDARPECPPGVSHCDNLSHFSVPDATVFQPSVAGFPFISRGRTHFTGHGASDAA